MEISPRHVQILYNLPVKLKKLLSEHGIHIVEDETCAKVVLDTRGTPDE